MIPDVLYRQIGRDSHYKFWHAGNRHMLIYMNSDGGSLVYQGGIYEIQKGVLCLVSAGCQHYTMPEDPQTYTRSKLFLPEDAFQRMSIYLESEKPIRRCLTQSVVYARIPPELWDTVDALYLSLSQSYEHGEELFRHSSLFQLIGYLETYAEETGHNPVGFAAVVMAYIHGHILEDITIDDICAHVHMSKFHFCRKFKEMTGMTVMDYILKTRIMQAKNMLVRGDLSVGQVGENCGFSSLSYFSRVFREHTGMSPLQYRKNSR